MCHSSCCANYNCQFVMKDSTDHTPPPAAVAAGMSAESKEKKRVLVTGGAGFIGSHVCEALLRRGDEVVVVDDMNDSYDIRLKYYNLSILKSSYDIGKLSVYNGDICDDGLLKEIFEKEELTHIIHLAARAGVRPSIHNPSLYVRTNVDGTSKLLDLARQYNIKNFVFASSSSVYGGSLNSVLSESDVVSKPVSPYAATKITCELLAFTFHHLYGLNATGLRFFTVYGPRGRPDMAPFKFIDRIARGVPIQQFGDGTTSRDYTYISDIVNGVVLALDTPLGYEILNLGNGKPFQLSKFIAIVENAVGREAKIEMLPKQPGDVDRTCASIDRAKDLLGYESKVTFEEGISKTVDWYKFFFSVIFPGGTVGNQISPDSPLGNPFSDLGDSVSIMGSEEMDLEISSNVVKAPHQIRSRRSRLNFLELNEEECPASGGVEKEVMSSLGGVFPSSSEEDNEDDRKNYGSSSSRIDKQECVSKDEGNGAKEKKKAKKMTETMRNMSNDSILTPPSSSSFMEEEEEKKLVLFVTVVSGRGLAAATSGAKKDFTDFATSFLVKASSSLPLREREKNVEKEKMGDSKPIHCMKPYVRLSYGDNKQHTSPVLKSSLLPVWNESFIFPFQENVNFKMTVYNKVAFGRDEIIGETYMQMPSSQHPVAKWYSLKTRRRTVVDLGRRMVEQKTSGQSIGQIFIAALLLDPLELTKIGQGLLELPQAGGISCRVNPLPLTEEETSMDISSPKLLVEQLDNVQTVRGIPVATEKQSFKNANFDNTMGSYLLFSTFCSLGKKRLMHAYSLWKFMTEMQRYEEKSICQGNGGGEDKNSTEFQNMKKQCMEARFFARASQHKIKALESKLNSIHNDKYAKEIAAARAKSDVGQELSAAIARAEVAESLVKSLEEEMMGRQDLPDIGNSKKPLPPKPGLPPAPHRRRSSAGGELRQAQEEKDKMKASLVIFFTFKSSFQRRAQSAIRRAFCKWKERRASSEPPSSAIPELLRQVLSERDDTADKAAHAILSLVGEDQAAEERLVKTLKAMEHKELRGRQQLLLHSIAGFFRSQVRQGMMRALSKWKNAVQHGSVAKSDNTKLVHEDLLLEAEKKFLELKKKSDAYQTSVKAHWAKTEQYMTKLKSMLGEEKQKRKELKEQYASSISEIESLKVQLETAKRDKAQADLEMLSKHHHREMDSSSRLSRRLAVSTSSRAISCPVEMDSASSSGAPSPSCSPSTPQRVKSTPPQGGLDIDKVSIPQGTPPGRPPRPTSYSLSPVKLASSGVSIGIQTDDSDWRGSSGDSVQLDGTPVETTSGEKSGTDTTGGDSINANSEVDEKKNDAAAVNNESKGDANADVEDAYYDYSAHWEALYAQSQEQLACEVYAKEEAERSLVFANQQLEALKLESANEQTLVSQLMSLVEDATHSNATAVLAFEKSNSGSNSHSSEEDKFAKGKSNSSNNIPFRRGSISRRMSSSGSLDSSSALSPAVESSARGSKARGQKHTYLLSSSSDKLSRSEEKKRIAFSSKITQLNFERSGSLDDSDDDQGSIGSETNGNNNTVDDDMPVLPDVNFSAIIEEIEEESESLQRKKQSVTQSDGVSGSSKLLDAAMNAKIPKSKSHFSGETVLNQPQIQTVAPKKIESINADDPMDYIWQYISQQKDNPTLSGDSSNVRVAIRMRPLNTREMDLHASKCVNMFNSSDLAIEDEETTIENKFSFDYCFDAAPPDPDHPAAGNQQQVFDKLGLEVLTNAWNGYNASLFAYGQTGSGKSYSMMGTDVDPGIIPRVCMALFYLIQRHYENVESESKSEPGDRQFSVEASYLEIYNERIRDLLDHTRSNLRVREHPQTGVFVENLSTCAVESYKDISDLLEMGLEQRTTASTNMNSESSRSHSVFTIVIRMQSILTNGKKSVRLCKLCLVDLAGSERASSTGATGARLKEGANINKSLSTLGRCISALAKAASASSGDKSKQNIPFRESVLTWLLRESLCGNAKTAMLATISPANVNFGETMSTLRYANSAKMIATKAVVNEDPTTKIINELRSEVLRLREELSKSQGGGSNEVSSDGRSAVLNEKIKDHLIMAENALKTYAKAWETKEQSMINVKSQLQKRRAGAGITTTSFGIGTMSQEQVSETPYLVSLSSDPMLHLAVKVYIPAAFTLRIGKAQAEGEESNDLQLEGLGIEPTHCSVHHSAETGEVQLSVHPSAACYVNGSPVTAMSTSDEDSTAASVLLKGGDRIVLGVCSHVFAFIDPRCIHSPSNLQDQPQDLRSYIDAQEKLSSHDQAIREVIIGRVETVKEKELRLATMISNLWTAPVHRRLFEDRLVQCLKVVREASSISTVMCATSGIFFETTLGSTVDSMALHSLKTRDLFAYRNITIRVRCCCLVSPYDFPPAASPSSSSGPERILTRQTSNYGVSHGGEGLSAMTNVISGNAQRIARFSRAGSHVSPVGGSALSSNQLQHLRQVKFLAEEGKSDEAAPRRPSLTREKSSASILLERWRAEEAVLLFEANLDDFEDGMGVLRGLYSATSDLRSALRQLRKVSLRSLPAVHKMNTSHGALLEELADSVANLLSASGFIIDCTGDEERLYALLNDGNLTASGDDGDLAVTTIISHVGEVMSELELDSNLFQEMFRFYADHYRQEGSAAGSEDLLVHSLLDSLEACLHEGVVDCFSSPNLLVNPVDDEEEGTASDAGANKTPAGVSVERCREAALKQQSELAEIKTALHEIFEKKEQLLSMERDDVQVAYEQDPYAYDDSYQYDYNYDANAETSISNSAYQYTEEDMQNWTEEEKQLYAWQCEQGNSNDPHQQEEYEYDESYWDDATDWVRHYDEASGKYFYYSESLQESRWEG